MDFGRLFYVAAVADGVVEPQPLSRAVFVALEAAQGRSVQRFHGEVGFGFDEHAKLHAKLSKHAKPCCPPPEWAARASTCPLWPGVLIASCEYAQCVELFGYARVRFAAMSAKTSGVDVQTAVDEYVQSRGQGGRCLTAILVDKVLATLAGTKGVASRKSSKSAAVDEHIETTVMLASHGLIPKLFWWSTPDVLAILEGARLAAEDAGTKSDAALALAIQIHERLVSTASASSADLPRSPPPTKSARTWHHGSDKVACNTCGKIVRRSGISKHRASCVGEK